MTDNAMNLTNRRIHAAAWACSPSASSSSATSASAAGSLGSSAHSPTTHTSRGRDDQDATVARE